MEMFRLNVGIIGLDLEAAKKTNRRHKYDGKKFGWWTVQPGSYSCEKLNFRNVECKCICGTVRRVSVNALEGGTSRGCGCRNKTAGLRRRVPWVCISTDQRVENTQELAQLVGVTSATLHRRIRKGVAYKASDGNIWQPLISQEYEHRQGYDGFNGLIGGELFDKFIDRKTEFYIYHVQGFENMFKVGIAFNADQRSKATGSNGLYGEFITAWQFNHRVHAILIEESILRDKSFGRPSKEVIHLMGATGYSEIRKANLEQLILHAGSLVESLLDASSWVEWAKANINELNRWELKRLNELSFSSKALLKSR